MIPVSIFYFVPFFFPYMSNQQPFFPFGDSSMLSDYSSTPPPMYCLPDLQQQQNFNQNFQYDVPQCCAMCNRPLESGEKKRRIGFV